MEKKQGEGAHKKQGGAERSEKAEEENQPKKKNRGLNAFCCHVCVWILDPGETDQ